MFRRMPSPPPPGDVNIVGQQRPPRTQQQQYNDDEYSEDDPHASLIQSVTAEDDEVGDDDAYTYNNNHEQYNLSHGALVQQVRNSSSKSVSSSNKNSNKSKKNNKKNQHRQAVAYLLRYETMVRQQEAEDMATMAHLRPCFERILQLIGDHDDHDNESLARSVAHREGGGGGNNSGWSSLEYTSTRHDDNNKDNDDDDDAAFWKQEITFADLKKVLIIMEESESSSTTPEFMTTDRQLLMVLRLLAQKANDVPNAEDGSTTSCSSQSGAGDEHGPFAHDEESSSNNNSNVAANIKITWAEVMQCYKVCIAGMHVLQHLPALSSSSALPPAVAGAADSVVPVHDIIRTRARDRTLTMLSLFEPPSTRLFTDEIDNQGGVLSRSLAARRAALQHHDAAARGGVVVDSDTSAIMTVMKETATACMSKWKRIDKRQRGKLMLTLVAILLVIATFWSNRTEMMKLSHASTSPKDSASRSTPSTSQPQQMMMKSPVVYNKSPTASSYKMKTATRNHRLHPWYTQSPSPVPFDANNHNPGDGSVSTGASSAQCATRTVPGQHVLGNAVGGSISNVDSALLLQPAIVGAILGAPVIVATVQLVVAGLSSGSLLSTVVCGAGVVSLISVAFRAAKHWLERFTIPS